MQTHDLRCAARLGALLFLSWATSAALAAEIEPTEPARADAALVRFVQAAVDSNPRVKAARAAVEASSAYRDAAARPLHNPELSLEAENAGAHVRALGISQSLDWAGKRDARTAVAESDRLLAEAEYSATQWDVTVELLNGLALHQTGIERKAVADSRQQLIEELLTGAGRGSVTDDLSPLDMDLTRLSAIDARIQAATAAADLAEARQAVRNLAPQSSGAQWPLLPSLLPPISPAADPQTLLLALPEVLAARRQVESAQALVELRRRERRPDPTLSLAGGEEDDESLIGLSLTIPLFVRNRFHHEVTAALAERSQAQQLAADVLQRARARLNSAAERYEFSRKAWEDWATAGQASVTRQSAELQRQWQAGKLPTGDYLARFTAILDVQESALDLRAALWSAWFEWLSASGRGDIWLAHEGTQ